MVREERLPPIITRWPEEGPMYSFGRAVVVQLEGVGVARVDDAIRAMMERIF